MISPQLLRLFTYVFPLLFPYDFYILAHILEPSTNLGMPPLALQSAFAVINAQFTLKEYYCGSYCGYISLLIYVTYGQEIN
jgi:hypothetical protein